MFKKDVFLPMESTCDVALDCNSKNQSQVGFLIPFSTLSLSDIL